MLKAAQCYGIINFLNKEDNLVQEFVHTVIVFSPKPGFIFHNHFILPYAKITRYNLPGAFYSKY